MDITNTAEIIVSQGKNTLNSMENLKRYATKKDKSRSDLFEKFCANEHSLRAYMDAEIGQSSEVITFTEKVALFGENFIGVNIDFELVVDNKEVQSTYYGAISSYNTMAIKLGFENEARTI